MREINSGSSRTSIWIRERDQQGVAFSQNLSEMESVLVEVRSEIVHVSSIESPLVLYNWNPRQKDFALTKDLSLT